MWRIRIRQSLYLLATFVAALFVSVYLLEHDLIATVSNYVYMYVGALFALFQYGVKE